MIENDPADDDGRGISTRSVEVVVALLLLAFGATIVFDSYRLGASWGSDGPQSGYFPFYIGLLICLSAGVTLAQALFKRKSTQQFVSWSALRQVTLVLIPAAVYVLAVELIGIYIASAIYIAIFMRWLGKYGWTKSILVGVGVTVAMFVLFEIWFKVPLYKGLWNPLWWTGY